MDKITLRNELRFRRSEIDPNSKGEALLQTYLASGIGFGIVAACYWPIRDEIDTRPLIRHLRQIGTKVVLPRIERGSAHIAFHTLEGDTPDDKDGFGIPAPSRSAEMQRPDIIFVPLLGFDAAGGRIGYGRGFYDKAISAARSEGPVDIVGLAFAAQEVDDIPREAHDATLDWVITDEGVKVRPDSK